VLVGVLGPIGALNRASDRRYGFQADRIMRFTWAQITVEALAARSRGLGHDALSVNISVNRTMSEHVGHAHSLRDGATELRNLVRRKVPPSSGGRSEEAASQLADLSLCRAFRI